MTTMPQPASTQVTVGVDAHADSHVAVAKEPLSRRLDATSVAATPAATPSCWAGPRAWASLRPGASKAPAPLGLG